MPHSLYPEALPRQDAMFVTAYSICHARELIQELEKENEDGEAVNLRFLCRLIASLEIRFQQLRICYGLPEAFIEAEKKAILHQIRKDQRLPSLR